MYRQRIEGDKIKNGKCLMTRKRYKDREFVGRSTICPRIRGEDHSQRHIRRKETNLELEDRVREWTRNNGLFLRITNNGHHWSFYAFDANEKEPQLFEWWPASAKMIIKKQWKNGIHIHDVDALMQMADKRLKKDIVKLKNKLNG